MERSRRSTTRTDDGRTHQSDGHSESSTDPGSPHPFHPTTGMLSLPKPSDAATKAAGHDDVHLEAGKVHCFETPSRTPSDDRLMTEDDIKQATPGVMNEYNNKRRAAGEALSSNVSESDEEGRDDVLETISAVPETPRRRATQTTSTRGCRVSRTSRPVPVRSNANEETGTTTRRLPVRGGTRSGLRSQTIAQTSQDDEVRIRNRDTAIGFEDDVDKISINDQRL
jgi:hypothetical protein